MPAALHPEASRALDAQASALLARVIRADTSVVVGGLASEAARPVAANMTWADLLGEIRILGANNWPIAVVRGERLTLEPSASGAFVELIRRTAERREFGGTSIVDYFAQEFMEWFRARLEAGERRTWPEYIAASLARDVVPRRVFVVLNGLELDASFECANATVGHFSPSQGTDGQPSNGRFDRHFAGRVYAMTGLETDLVSIKYFGRLVADDAVQVLRFFHPAAAALELRCGIARAGEASEYVDHMVVENDAGERRVVSEIDSDLETPPWRLSQEHITEIRAAGLDAITDFLRTELVRVTDLQKSAWTALNIFSRGVQLQHAKDRVLHGLVAAETLLLRNDAEPVQQSLRLRLGHLVGEDLEHRKRLVRDITSAYSLRSAFLHHGIEDVPEEQVASANRVLAYVRSAILACIAPRPEQTREALAAMLEDRILR